MDTGSNSSLMRAAQISLTGTRLKGLEEICNNIGSCLEETPKDLLVRVTGRFYTHEVIGQHLVNAVLQAAAIDDVSHIKVIEPFCGDGRLICWLLEAASNKRIFSDKVWDITLWDCDSNVLDRAKESILQAATKFDEHVDVKVNCGDTFQIAKEHFGEFSICITNPPWELLKPDRRELNSLKKADLEEYLQLLRLRDEFLKYSYSKAVPLKKFSGWGTNLARCGTEAALKLTVPGGVCGVVSPASLLADQVSELLRRWIFEENIVHDIAYYAAEARLFERVDQPSITLVASPGDRSKNPPKLNFYDKFHQKSELLLNCIEWQHLAANKFVFPLQFGSNLIKLNIKWENLPCFKDLENKKINGLWAGRELDETGYKRFIGDRGEYLFVKGRMIKRFGIAEAPTEYVKCNGPRIPKSANYYRIAWRDVSRPNQKRRIQATIIPPGWVTGNSLSIAYYRDNNIERLKALLALVNSFVFEAQARMHLVTAHVSLGVVRKVHLPILYDQRIINYLAELVDLCSEGDESSLIATEVQVAKLYGLKQDDFALLLSSFDGISAEERSDYLSNLLWGSDNKFKNYKKSIETYGETF